MPARNRLSRSRVGILPFLVLLFVPLLLLAPGGASRARSASGRVAPLPAFDILGKDRGTTLTPGPGVVAGRRPAVLDPNGLVVRLDGLTGAASRVLDYNQPLTAPS